MLNRVDNLIDNLSGVEKYPGEIGGMPPPAARLHEQGADPRIVQHNAAEPRAQYREPSAARLIDSSGELATLTVGSTVWHRKEACTVKQFDSTCGAIALVLDVGGVDNV